MSWRTYRVGNWLRANYEIKARSEGEAWKRGCARFNRSFPSDSKEGRLVILEVEERVAVRTTAWCLAEFKRPKKKRYFTNFDDPRTMQFWRPLAYGNSKQPLLKEAK